MNHVVKCQGNPPPSKRFCQALGWPQRGQSTEISSFRPHPVDPLTMSHFGPPDSKRQRVGEAISEGGWPGPSKAARQGLVKFSTLPRRLPACSLTPQHQFQLPWRPLKGGKGKFEGEGGLLRPPPSPSMRNLRCSQQALETPLPGSRNALERSKHQKYTGNFEFWTSSWGTPSR